MEDAGRARIATTLLRKILDNCEYKTPCGTINCRFCDNCMDHEGTYNDMHAPDCIIHEVRAALTEGAGE